MDFFGEILDNRAVFKLVVERENRYVKREFTLMLMYLQKVK